MIYLILISSIIIIAISVALAIMILNLLTLLLIRVPFVNTRPEYLQKIVGVIELAPGAIVYDLGCGSGHFIKLSQKFKPKKIIGLELSPWAYFIATINTLGSKNVEIKFQDFFTQDLRGADLVYIYLLPKMMERISKKLKNELRPGAQAITVGSPLPGLIIRQKIVLDEKDNYCAYLYQI